MSALLLTKACSLTAGQQHQSSRTIIDGNFHVTYYQLKLRLQTFPNSLVGSILIKAISKTESLQTMRLDLMQSTMTIDSILMDARRVHFLQDSAFFNVTLDRPYNVGELIILEIFYQNIPYTDPFGGFTYGWHGIEPLIWSFSELNGAKYWWPCKDHPSDKADSADIIVTVAHGLKVGSNGMLISILENNDGTVTYHWREQYPIAPYLISVAVSNYESFSEWFHYGPNDSMEVLNYILPGDLEEARSKPHYTIDGLTIFSKLFGLYPFVKEKYGHAETGIGGMEHQTMTSISFRGLVEDNIIHELAHQWFGDMITCRTWPDIWLNEGFATYCEALYMEKKYGDSTYASTIRHHMKSAMNENGTIFIQDTNAMEKGFNQIVYDKGAVVLHMLRHVLGDSTFFQAMYNYANDPLLKYNVASTADFQRVCETTSGKNLSYFFNEWIYGENYPKYKFTWTVVPEGRHYKTNVTLSQTTNTKNPSFFTMPTDIQFTDAGWDTTMTVLNDLNNQRFAFILSHKPTAASLDPGNWILKQIH